MLIVCRFTGLALTPMLLYDVLWFVFNYSGGMNGSIDIKLIERL